jgi:hypothetical protein
VEKTLGTLAGATTARAGTMAMETMLAQAVTTPVLVAMTPALETTAR